MFCNIKDELVGIVRGVFDGLVMTRPYVQDN